LYFIVLCIRIELFIKAGGIEMTKIVFCKKIEIMRSKLHDLIEQYGIDSDIVLNYSQELDKLMCEIESVDNVE